MIKSKAWNWDIASAPWWKEPASEVYPIQKRWSKEGFRRVLDLGCGIGRHSIYFAENGFKVDACDLSQEGITKLNEIIVNNSLNITTKVSDMLSLPYESNSFDGLIAFHVVYHTDDMGIKKVIEEIKRVLRNGGEAFITFNSKNSSSFKDSDNKHLSENTIIKIQGHEANIPHFYANRDDVENLLKDFEMIEFSYKEEYWQGQIYTGAHYFVLARKK